MEATYDSKTGTYTITDRSRKDLQLNTIEYYSALEQCNATITEYNKTVSTK